MQVAHCFTNDEDIVNVRDMRDELGKDIGIMIDVNQGWTEKKLLKYARRLKVMNLSGLRNQLWQTILMVMIKYVIQHQFQ